MTKTSTPSDEGYRADRLRRAWALIKSNGVERHGDGCFTVAGNDESSYDVNLNVSPPCYCSDMFYRGRQIRDNCKHTLAARLSALDPSLLNTIADWLAAEQRHAATASTRRKKAHD